MQQTIRNTISLLAAAFIVISCATDKYPYPPQFANIEQVPPTVLAKPPLVNSAKYKKAIDAVLARQKKLNPAQISVLQNEDPISPSMIILPVLGANATPERLPATYALLRHAGSDAWRIADNAQDYWKNPRPWVVDDRVALHVGSIKRPGYPSGHTTTNYVWAHVLGEQLPCKKTALFKRANEIGYHRVDAGVHFPFHIEAGKKMAQTIYDTMTRSPDYRTMASAARAELLATTALNSNCQAKR